MSNRMSWKMLHLIFNSNTSGLTFEQLTNAGIDCEPDTRIPMVTNEVVEVKEDGKYYLTKPAIAILNTCIVANRDKKDGLLWVDRPIVFAVMPFSEPWSDRVYKEMIKPAIERSGFECIRGDTPIRVGDLTSTIWNAIMETGLMIADVSSTNPNVFYEIGLAHGLGKDVFIIKQDKEKVPADFYGTHYYEYDLSNLEAGRIILSNAINKWGLINHVEGVRAITDP